MGAYKKLLLLSQSGDKEAVKIVDHLREKAREKAKEVQYEEDIWGDSEIHEEASNEAKGNS